MKVLVVCGPTASGKTALAVDCARALRSEIISADSMLVYKGLNIGTAKPTKEEMGGIRHHLIDVAGPTQIFSVSDYDALALPVLERLLSEGKTPVVCGGTGFYIRALLYKSGFGHAGGSAEIRAKYAKFLEENGKEALHDLLKKKDPASAEILHPNDVKRVVRALEIFDLTGKRKSEQNDLPLPRFDFTAVCIGYPREELYARIDLRVEKMVEAGLFREVEELLEKGVPQTAQCMQGIGYKEVAEGLCLRLPAEEIAENIKKNTRNYAKRQITFFKRMPDLTVLPPEESCAAKVLELL